MLARNGGVTLKRTQNLRVDAARDDICTLLDADVESTWNTLYCCNAQLYLALMKEFHLALSMSTTTSSMRFKCSPFSCTIVTSVITMLNSIHSAVLSWEHLFIIATHMAASLHFAYPEDDEVESAP